MKPASINGIIPGSATTTCQLTFASLNPRRMRLTAEGYRLLQLPDGRFSLRDCLVGTIGGPTCLVVGPLGGVKLCSGFVGLASTTLEFRPGPLELRRRWL